MAKERPVTNPSSPARRLLNGTERLEAPSQARPFGRTEPEGKAEKQMGKPSIATLISSQDPLSEEAMGILLGYREEDIHFDCKETLQWREEREWLEITKDIMAFANTYGGYLLFGVRDRTYEIVGVDSETANVLTDVNMFQQKVNRYLEPPILHLRAKAFERDGKALVGMFIPRLQGRTHVVSKDGKFQNRSGEERTVLKQGMIYVRRSAGNHLADSRDIDDIVARRLEEFKSSLLSSIARVVEAPPQSKVFVLSEDPTDETGTKFIIDDSPDSLPVKGMSFTIAPKTPEQEIAGWVSILQRTPAQIPPIEVLWQWYARRDDICINASHKLAVAKFCLFAELPVFYWLQGCPAIHIRQLLGDVVTRVRSGQVEGVVKVGAFLGRKFYDSLVRKLENPKRHLSRTMLTFPVDGAHSLFSDPLIQQIKKTKCKGNQDACQAYIQSELDSIAVKLGTNPGVEGEDHLLARAYDCYLYAQNDKYMTANDQETDDLCSAEDTSA